MMKNIKISCYKVGNEWILKGGNAHRVFDIPARSEVAPSKGATSTFIFTLNYGHKSDLAGVYALKGQEVLSDECLRALCFGDSRGDGSFIGSALLAEFFQQQFSDKLIGLVFIDTLESLDSNKGIALEKWLCREKGYTHGSLKQDKGVMKIDVISPVGTRCQCKCSVATPATHWAYPKTNRV